MKCARQHQLHLQQRRVEQQLTKDVEMVRQPFLAAATPAEQAQRLKTAQGCEQVSGPINIPDIDALQPRQRRRIQQRLLHLAVAQPQPLQQR